MFNGGDSGGLEELISQSIIQTNNKDIIIDHVNHAHDHDHNSFNDDIAINDIVTTPFNINPNIDLLSPDNNIVFLDANKCIYTPLETTTTTDHQPGGFVLMPKLEQHINNYNGCNSNIDFINNMNLIGLNLLGHHYDHDHIHMCYSLLGEENIVVNVNDHHQLRRIEAGVMNVMPRCQIEGCNADLTLAKHYHRRHKVCEFHSKASIVLAAGVTQRYCQQCSRFHILSEFDEGKRSCRKRLADHNRRRRKSSHNESTNLINDQP